MPVMHQLSAVVHVMQADKGNGATSHHGDHSDDSGSESSDDEQEDRDKVRAQICYQCQSDQSDGCTRRGICNCTLSQVFCLSLHSLAKDQAECKF